MDAKLQLWIDKAEASESVRRYFLALDRFDWDEVRRLVADEFQLIADAPGVAPTAVPREDFVRTLIERNGGFTGTFHINADHVVDITGDRAHVSAHMWAFHKVGEAPEDRLWGIGLYEIDLVRGPECWQLSAQKIQAIQGEGAGSPADIFGRAAERQKNGLGR